MDVARSDCRICRAIPDSTSERPLPAEVGELVGNRLLRCPECDAYYLYFYDHDSGGGTSEGGTDEGISRLTVDETIRWLCDAINDLPLKPMPRAETDLERLLRNHVRNEPPETLMKCVEERVIAADMLGNEAAQLAAHLLGARRAVEAIPVLERALARYELRGHAARAIASMGEVALPTLMAHLAADANPVARTAAMGGLSHLARIRPTTAPTIQAALLQRLAALRENPGLLLEHSSREAAAAVCAIGMTGHSAPAFAALTDLFPARYGWHRDAAIRAVGRMGRAAPAVVVPSLIGMLSRLDNREVVEATILSLKDIGPAARDALPALAALPTTLVLNHWITRTRDVLNEPPDPEPCRICRWLPDRSEVNFHELEHFRGAASDLCKCPLCGTYYDYFYAHYAGGDFGCDPYTDEWVTRLTPVNTIDRIRRALHQPPFDPNPIIEADLEALLRRHPPLEESIASTIERLVDDTIANEAHAQRAAWLLGRRKAVDAIPALARALARENVRYWAARALASMGAVAAPTLLTHLEVHLTAAERTAAACGLGHLARVEPDLSPAIQRALLARLVALEHVPRDATLHRLALDENDAVAWAIGMTGYSEAAFDALSVLLRSSGAWRARAAAVHAVARMGAVTVPSLLRMLADGDAYAAESVTLALAAIGPAARDALPVLEAHPLVTRYDFEHARDAITGAIRER